MFICLTLMCPHTKHAFPRLVKVEARKFFRAPLERAAYRSNLIELVKKGASREKCIFAGRIIRYGMALCITFVWTW